MATIKEWNEQPRRRSFSTPSFEASWAPRREEPFDTRTISGAEARVLTATNLLFLSELNLEHTELTGYLTGNTIDTLEICGLSSAVCLVLEHPRRAGEFFLFYSDDVWKFALSRNDPIIEQADVLFSDTTTLLGSFSSGVLPVETLRGMMRPSFTQRQQQQQEINSITSLGPVGQAPTNVGAVTRSRRFSMDGSTYEIPLSIAQDSPTDDVF